MAQVSKLREGTAAKQAVAGACAEALHRYAGLFCMAGQSLLWAVTWLTRARAWAPGLHVDRPGGAQQRMWRASDAYSASSTCRHCKQRRHLNQWQQQQQRQRPQQDARGGAVEPRAGARRGGAKAQRAPALRDGAGARSAGAGRALQGESAALKSMRATARCGHKAGQRAKLSEVCELGAREVSGAAEATVAAAAAVCGGNLEAGQAESAAACAWRWRRR